MSSHLQKQEKLLADLSKIILNQNTPMDQIKAIILCHRLLFPPDKFLDSIYNTFVNSAEEIVSEELKFQSKIVECSNKNMYQMQRGQVRTKMGTNYNNNKNNNFQHQPIRFMRPSTQSNNSKMGMIPVSHSAHNVKLSSISGQSSNNNLSASHSLSHQNNHNSKRKHKVIQNQNNLQSQKRLHEQNMASYSRNPHTQKLPMVSEMTSTTPLFVQTNDISKNNKTNKTDSDNYLIETKVVARDDAGKFLWQTESSKFLNFNGRNPSNSTPVQSPLKKVQVPKVPQPKIPRREPIKNQKSNKVRYENIPENNTTNLSSPANSQNSQNSQNSKNLSSEKDSGYISHSLHSITPTMTSPPQEIQKNSTKNRNLIPESRDEYYLTKRNSISRKNNQPVMDYYDLPLPNETLVKNSHSSHFLSNSNNNYSNYANNKNIHNLPNLLTSTVTLVSKKHQDKMNKLSLHLYNVLKEWSLEISPHDFANQITSNKNKNHSTLIKSLNKKSRQNILSSISCNEILENMTILVANLSPRIGENFDVLKQDIQMYHKCKGIRSTFSEDLDILRRFSRRKEVRGFSDSDSGDNLLSLTNLITEAIKINKLPKKPDPASVLQSHLLAVQLYNMNEINLCDLAMAGIRTLSPFQQKRVDIMSGYNSSLDQNNSSSTDTLATYINWCEKLTHIISSEILAKNTTVNQRAEYINILFDTAIKCINSGDLSSAMIIWSGISIAPIMRLKKTWAKINTTKQKVLEHIFDPNKNFQNYRAALRFIAMKPTTSSSQRIVLIPCMSLLLKDLLYLTKKAADMKNSQTNILMDRWSKLSTPVIRYRQWTIQGFKALKDIERGTFDPVLTSFLRILPDEEDLALASLQNNKLNKTSATRFSQNQKNNNNKMSKTSEMMTNTLLGKDNLESNQFEVMSYTLESPINKWEKSQFRNLKSCKGPNQVKLGQCYKVNMVA